MSLVMSPSCIYTLKQCPVKYRNAYVLGIRKKEQPESRRIGVNWHEGQELMSLNPEQPCPVCSAQMYPDKECTICQGTGFVDDPTDALVRTMNKKYDTLYPWLPKDAAETERAIILFSLFAHRFHYENKDMEVVAREIPFRIPLVGPDGHAVTGVSIDGMIDKIVLHDGQYKVLEYKSTSDSVAPDSDYWGHLRLDTQTTLYTYAAQRLAEDGLLIPYGIKPGAVLGEIIYDVWRKPQIRPKKLSQTDTTAFITSCSYFNQNFTVSVDCGQSCSVVVDGVAAEVEQLKKGFSIRETPYMFGCRLFDEISAKPDYYFARRLITRTSEDLERFERELYNLYLAVASMKKDNSWYHNEFSCDSMGRCDYTQFCYTGQDLSKDNPPPGFECIFNKGKK